MRLEALTGYGTPIDQTTSTNELENIRGHAQKCLAVESLSSKQRNYTRKWN
jgi:hypothetical protein